MVTKRVKPEKVKTKRFKLLKVYKQRWNAILGPAAGEEEHGEFYGTTLKKLRQHVVPYIEDDAGDNAAMKKAFISKVKLIDIGDCDYREVLHVEDFPESNCIDADLSFLKGKYSYEAFKITIILYQRKIYFLGPKIDIKNIKTSWF